MSTSQDRLSPFEARLLGELKRAVATRRAEAGSNVTAGRTWRPRLVVAGGVAAVVAVGIAAGVPFLGGGGTQAYAVTKNNDGSVTVEVSSLKDAAGLEQKLRDAGIPAAVQYIPSGKACKEPTFVPATGGPSRTQMEVGDSGALRFTLDRGDLPAGTTLVIYTQQLEVPQAGGGAVGASSIGVGFAKGAVAPCKLVDAPSAFPPVPVQAGAGGGATNVTPAGGSGPSLDHSGAGQVSG